MAEEREAWENLRAEIDALPTLKVAGQETTDGPGPVTPLQIVSRQGRLILRLSAASEALELRYKELAEQRQADVAARESAEDRVRRAEQETRQIALEAIRLMDVLDWVQDALTTRGDSLTKEVASAQRDCLRRLAAVGITEIPVQGMMDGRLHEGVDTVEAPAGIEKYHIVSVVRRGWIRGIDVLRKATVITAS